MPVKCRKSFHAKQQRTATTVTTMAIDCFNECRTILAVIDLIATNEIQCKYNRNQIIKKKRRKCECCAHTHERGKMSERKRSESNAIDQCELWRSQWHHMWSDSFVVAKCVFAAFFSRSFVSEHFFFRSNVCVNYIEFRVRVDILLVASMYVFVCVCARGVCVWLLLAWRMSWVCIVKYGICWSYERSYDIYDVFNWIHNFHA